jgi:DNA-binding CsgD family transcriptional regulator
MSVGRSGRLVGRERELTAFGAWLARAGTGTGGVYVIGGEPGVGKSRLAAEAVALLPATWLVARGRAADRDRPVPFRAVAEALLGASRHRILPDDPDTRAFAAVLGHLVPAWRQGAGAEEPIVVVAEAVLRVLQALADPAPAALVIEDIQWADPETLAVLEYLADNVGALPLAVIATLRTDTPSPGLDMVRALAARRVATMVELSRLDPDEVSVMASECLGTATPEAGGLGASTPGADATSATVSPEIRAFLDRAGGLPFLVEELIATAARDGILVSEEGRWTLTGVSAELVPDSYLGSVSRRLIALTGTAARLLHLAAVAGLSTDMRVLAQASGLSAAEVGVAVQAARDLGLVVVDRAGGRAEFRHALVRDAVLADLPPGERAALAAQALDALTADGAPLPGAPLPGDVSPSDLPPGDVSPGDLPPGDVSPGDLPPGDVLELAVDLAEQAGELARSARLLLTLARRSMSAGGLATAEACLQRARRRTAGEPELTASVDEAMLELLVHKGDLRELAEVAAAALATLARLGADPRRAANVHLRVARAAAAAGDPAWATDEATRARALALLAGDEALRLSVDVATADAMLTAGDTVGAAALARQVISAGQAATPALLQAWMIVGRAERMHDLDAAAAAFDAAHQLASRSGSPLAELEALHEAATVAMLAHADTGPLLAALARAEQLGAVGLAAQLNLQLAGTYALTGRAAQSLPHAGRARDLAHRLRQVTVEAMALVQTAAAHATREDRAAMQAAIDAALALAGGDPNVIGGVWGHAHGMYALLREDRAAAREALDRAAAVEATGMHGVFWAAWALVSLLNLPPGGPAEAITGRLESAQVTALPVNRGLAGYAHAVAAGLRGDRDQAGRLVAEAERVLSAHPAFGLWRQLARRLAAEAALAGGWGDPVAWLRECLAAFDADGHRRTASACRALLHAAGAPVPRRSGGAGAPPGLAALGVTARETDVLGLIAEGMTNREIGERLFLSPRTVEKHVERLLTKTGAQNRSQLVAWAARGAAGAGTAGAGTAGAGTAGAGTAGDIALRT